MECLNKRKHCGQGGFTLIEMLAASFLSMLVLTLSLGVIDSQRNTFKYDIVRTKVNQNLRSALDIISLNVRQAGEAFPDFFPAILLSSGTTDELIIRRNLYENEILNVCQALTAGSSNTSVLFATNTANPACAYNAALVPYKNTWDAHRTSEGGTAKAYVYNRSSRLGEFFTFNGSTNNGVEMAISKTASSWANSYPGDGNSAAMYLAEEYKFRVSSGVLQIVRNEDTVNVLNVVDSVSNFQVNIVMRDGTVMNSFTAADRWPDIQYIELHLTGRATFGKRIIDNTVTAKLFPRNILSK
jgi:Tfp pilus assembly protein PilW